MTNTATTTEVKQIDYQTDSYFVRKYVSCILTRLYSYQNDSRWADFPNDEVLASEQTGSGP